MGNNGSFLFISCFEYADKPYYSYIFNCMKKAVAFFKLIRWFNVLIAGASILLFQHFVINANMKVINVSPTLSVAGVWMLALSVMSIMAAGNVINDYFDFAQDKKFKPNRTVLGSYISLDEAMYIVFALNALGIGLAFFLAWKVESLKLANIFLLTAILLWQYSATLKKYPLVGNVLVAGLCGFVFAVPVLFESKLLQPEFNAGLKQIVMLNLQGYALFAFLTTLIREIAKDVEDMDADASTNHKTLPILIGVKATRIVLVMLVLLLCAGIGFLMYVFWNGDAKNHFWYSALFLMFPALVNMLPLVVADSKIDFKVQSTIMKVVMIFGIATLPLFYYFSK